MLNYRWRSFLFSFVWATCTIAVGQEPLTNPFDLLPNSDQGNSDSSLGDAPAQLDSKSPTENSNHADLPVPIHSVGEPDTDPVNNQNSNSDAGTTSTDPPSTITDNAEGAPRELLESFDVSNSRLETEAIPKKFRRAVMIQMDGPIFGQFHWFLNQKLEWAKSQEVDLVIVNLTTPGGDLEYSLQLGRSLRDIDWATTVVFVPERAISGGAIMSLGADLVLMQRNALIGDAGPVTLGMDGLARHAPEKAISYTAGAVRELAETTNRPAAVAEAMVDRDTIVFSATERATGRPTWVTKAETEAGDFEARFKLGDKVPETGNNRFLTIGGQRALELGICDQVFDDQEAMLGSLNISELQTVQLTWVDKTVYVLNRPMLTGLLLLVGIIGLYIEVSAPGIGVAGLVSLCSFGVFFWSHALGGTAGWLEVMLFLLGGICIACELFVLPGFGIFGVSGIFLICFSLIMASQDFIIPNSAIEWQILQRNALLVLGSLLAVLVAIIAQLVFLDSLPGLHRFRLGTPADANLEQGLDLSHSLASATTTVTFQPNIGSHGVSESVLRPSGKARFNGHLVDVLSEGDYIDPGTPIEVIRRESNKTVVRATS
ncbi:MAG: hypothetical protein KDB03_06665 [Planctomycetales bacterium]|nr:hypothetical protein [Planctomycetales bacterium]